MTTKQAWTEAKQILEDVLENLTDLARIDTDEDDCEQAYDTLSNAIDVLDNYHDPDDLGLDPTIQLNIHYGLALTTTDHE